MFANMFYVVKQTSVGEVMAGRVVGTTKPLEWGHLGSARETQTLPTEAEYVRNS